MKYLVIIFISLPFLSCNNKAPKLGQEELQLIDVDLEGAGFKKGDEIIWLSTHQTERKLVVVSYDSLNGDSLTLVDHSQNGDKYLFSNETLSVFTLKYLFNNSKPQNTKAEIIKDYLTQKFGSPHMSHHHGFYTWNIGDLKDTIEHRGFYDLVYESMNLNGKSKESSFVGKDTVALQYTVGIPNQVIPAFSQLLNSKKSIPSKCKILVYPSMGYGETGSSTGIVEPDDYLLYNLEIY